MAARFVDRAEAGRILAGRLERFANRSDVVVLGLPRGGVPVAFEVAQALAAPLDVFVVRKLGVPGQEELAMGAIASGGTRVLNDDVIETMGIPESVIQQAVHHQQEELERREQFYRDGRPLIDVRGKIVILIDDGLATGASMRAAIHALRQKQPAALVVAVPVAAAPTCQDLRREADEVICAIAPDVFYAVGLWYQDFSQTTDEQVRDLLSRSVHA
jgi:putative phosphoribosyl transferase